MNSRNLLVVGIVIVILLGGFFLLSNKNTNTPKIMATVNPTARPASSPSAKMENRITLTKNGFEPQTLKIKVGTTVVWVNNSGDTATVNSDPHPTHTLFPFLNLGSFDDGSSLSVKFDKVGVYTYHNHLNPTETGTIIVE